MYGFSAYSSTPYSSLSGGGGTSTFASVQEAFNASADQTVISIRLADVAESVNASTALSILINFAGDVSDAISIAATLSPITNFVTNVSEQGSFSSLEVGTLVYPSAYADTVQVSSTQTAVSVRLAAVYEYINNLYDVESGKVNFAGPINESIAASTTVVPVLVFAPSITETVLYTAVVEVASPAASTINERVQLTPTLTPASTQHVALAEQIRLLDTETGHVVFVGALANTVNVSTVQTVLRQVFGSINITVNATAAIRFENANEGFFSDTVRARASTSEITVYNVTLVNTVGALARFITASDVTTEIAEGVRVSVFFVGEGLWREVANTPTGGWVLVDGGGTTPSGGWGASQGGTTYPSGGWRPVETVPN